jgi:hypothetical protein
MVDKIKLNFLRRKNQDEFFWRNPIDFENFFNKKFKRKWKEKINSKLWNHIFSNWQKHKSSHLTEDVMEIFHKIQVDKSILTKFWNVEMNSRRVHLWKSEPEYKTRMIMEFVIQILMIIQQEVVKCVYPIIQSENLKKYNLGHPKGLYRSNPLLRLENELMLLLNKKSQNYKKFNKKMIHCTFVNSKDDINLNYNSEFEHFDIFSIFISNLTYIFSENFNSKLNKKWHKYEERINLSSSSEQQESSKVPNDIEMSMMINYVEEVNSCKQMFTKFPTLESLQILNDDSESEDNNEGDDTFLKLFMPSAKKEKPEKKEEVCVAKKKLISPSYIIEDIPETLSKRNSDEFEMSSKALPDYLVKDSPNEEIDHENSSYCSESSGSDVFIYENDNYQNSKFLSNLFNR